MLKPALRKWDRTTLEARTRLTPRDQVGLGLGPHGILGSYLRLHKTVKISTLISYVSACLPGYPPQQRPKDGAMQGG